MDGHIDRVSTHVLDVARGVPAAGIEVVLVREPDGALLGRAVTDPDGRVERLNDEPFAPVDVRLTFDVAAWVEAVHGTVFHPWITVHARLDGTRAHYHLPVLTGPFLHTTYLGS